MKHIRGKVIFVGSFNANTVGTVSVCSTVIIIKAKKKTVSRTCVEKKKNAHTRPGTDKNHLTASPKAIIDYIPKGCWLSAVSRSLVFFFALVFMAHHAPTGWKPLIHFSSSVQCSDTPSPPPSTMDQHLSAGADGICQSLKSVSFQLPVSAAPRQSSCTTVGLRSLSFQRLGRLILVFFCFLLLFAAGDSELGDQRLFIIVTKSCRDLTE